MGDITVVPVWIIQDISVLIAAVLMVFISLIRKRIPKQFCCNFLVLYFLRRRF